jgi:hypothetical protein
MSIFGILRQAVAAATSPRLSILDEDDDFLRPPQGSLFYEIIPIPEGPGVRQIKMLCDILPPMDIENGPWIAGGAARRLLQGQGLESGDVDLFFKDSRSWKQFCNVLSGFELVIKTKRASTYLVHGIKVQCIKRKFYLGLEFVFKDFDFSACQIATNGENLACTKQAHLDIVDQVLRLAPQGTIAKSTLVQRMSKYVAYGMLPEPGLFELIVKSGLDYVNAFDIFKTSEVSIYDPEVGEMVQETLPSGDLDAGVMRTIARQLGLEKTYD